MVLRPSTKLRAALRAIEGPDVQTCAAVSMHDVALQLGDQRPEHPGVAIVEPTHGALPEGPSHEQWRERYLAVEQNVIVRWLDNADGRLRRAAADAAGAPAASERSTPARLPVAPRRVGGRR